MREVVKDANGNESLISQNPLDPPYLATVPFFADESPDTFSILASHIENPELLAEEIDSKLVEFHSPAQGLGRYIVEEGYWHGINPRAALAFFIHESSAGTAPNWAGHKPDGTTTANIGNIIWTPDCGYDRYGRFRDYHEDWRAGTADFYRLLFQEYISPEIAGFSSYGKGMHDLKTVLLTYAPPEDNNNVKAYTEAVKNIITSLK